jgi:hypothetical protein
MTGDGSDTTLTLESTPTSDDNLLVFVDSVLQDAGAWSRSGTTLTFSEAPASSAVVKAWDLVSSTATNAAKLDALTADSSTTAFTLQQGGSTYTPSHANCLLVSVAGVMQEPGSGKAFTVSGSTLTFSTAPTTGATIWIVDVGSGVTANTPADDTVTSAKIVDGAIVNADINASAAIATSKISGLATSATTDTTSAANISSGTLATARMGSGTASSSTFLRGDGTWNSAGASTIAAMTDVTVSSSDPTVSTNPGAVGHLWINSTSGEAYVAFDVSAGANKWANIGDGGGGVAPLSCQYLVIAGGGAGGGGSFGAGVGGYRGAGGGGAGGYRTNVTGQTSGGGGSAEATFFPAVSTTYSVIVGAGGSGASLDNETNGNDSTFNNISSVGGGHNSPNATTQTTGGSGGGAAYLGSAGAGTANQGYAGGSGWSSSNQGSGGGGGGAGAVGENSASSATSTSGGDGGTGVASNITGSNVTRAGGGGGGHGGTGGNGGGATAQSGTNAGAGQNGTANTGGGGSGAAGSTNGGTVIGGNGGSGTVILKIEDSHQATFTGGVTQTVVVSGGYRTYTVTATSSTSETVTFSTV